MPDLVTLGFQFNSTTAEKNINSLTEKLEALNTKADLTRGIFDQIKINMSETAKVAREVSRAIKTMPNLSKLSGDKIKPVSQDTITSLVKFQESAKSALNSMQDLRTEVKGVKPVGVVSLGQELDKTNRKAKDLLGTFNKILSTGNYFKFISGSLKESVSFGEKVAQIASISQEFDTSKLRQEILGISSEFGNAAKLTDALYYAYSSGVRGTEKDMAGFTAQMGKLATVIRAEVTPTINAVTSAMNAYDLSVKDSGELTDLFYGIVKQGKASGEQLASSIGQVIPTAATAGVTLDELGASIASLTKVIQTRNAITYFNNMLSKMLKPTKETRIAAQKLGIDLSLSAVQAKGFAGMMEEIREKTKGSQQAILSLFPDLRGQRAALHLLGNGWKDFQAQLQFFGNKAGVADAAMKTLAGDINYQLSILPTTLGKIKIAVGDAIANFLTLGGALTPVVAAFNRMGEGTQKTVGVVAALVGGVTVLKTAIFAFNAAKAMEIKNNEIIARQQAREIRNRTKLAALSTAQAATGGASGLRGALRGNAGGFSGGFINSFGVEGLRGLKNWSSVFKTSKSAAKSVGLLTQATSMLGKGLGSLARLAIKIFSPLNVLIAAAAAAVTFVVDFLAADGNGFIEKLNNTKIIRPMADAIYGFFDSTIKKAERIKALEARVREIKDFQLDLDVWADELIAGFSNKSALPKKSLFSEVSETYKSAIAAISSKEFVNKLSAFQKNRKELNKLQKIAARDENGASRYLDIASGSLKVLFGKNSAEFKKYEKEFNEAKKRNVHADLKGIADRALAERLKSSFSPEEMIAVQSAYNNYWEKQKEAVLKQKEEAAKKAAELQQVVRADQSWVEKNIKTAQKASLDIRNMYKAFYDSLDSVSATVERVKFSMMSPEQQMKETEKSFAENMKKFYAVYQNDPVLAKQAFDSAVNAHNAIVQDAKKKLEKYKDFQTSLRKDAFDALLKSVSSLPEQLKIVRNEAIRIANEAKAETDLQKKYSLSKQAIELQISYMQKELDAKKRLAESEAEANRNTLQLIQSMDKFKTTAQDAVDANSVDAVKLQYRAFAAMPNFTPSTTAQNSYAAAEADLQKAYAKMAQIAEQMRLKAEERQRQEQARLDNQRKAMEISITRIGEVMTHWQDSINKLDKQQAELAKKLEEALKKVEENTQKAAEAMTKTADNTGKLARTLTSPAVYRG